MSVGFLLVEDLDRVDRVADVLRVLEPDRFDEAAVVYQQARDDSRTEHLQFREILE
jgi:hypothetical protein